MEEIKYSVVIPVFNSEKIIGAVVKKTAEFFRVKNLSYEIILINDGSEDGSWEIIKDLATSHKNVIAVNFLKNYGQHNAIFCGFHHVSGDFVITMDDDMQNPPEEISHLIEKANQGYDVVFGRFRAKKHNLARQLGSRIVGYLNTKIFQKPKDIQLSNFRIIRKDVIQRILNYQTSAPYIPGLVLMFSEKAGNVAVEHHSREVGKSNYSLTRIMRLVGTILFNYSSFPIKFFGGVGALIALTSFIYGIITILKRITSGTQVAGWTTVVVLLSFLGGYIILMLALLGEYLSRIASRMSQNKSYTIKEVIQSEPKD
jgi:glycosyltransferase involved in cell wall biosynthesis